MGGVMASKRKLRRKACDTKVTYADEATAQRAAIALRTANNRGVKTTWTNRRLGAYSCPHCRRWHVGHAPGKPGRKRRPTRKGGMGR
jgi:hypothetical protein